MCSEQIEVIDTSNNITYVDFGSESEGDDLEKKLIDDIKDFVKCNPMPDANDIDFWKPIFDRYVVASKIPQMVVIMNINHNIIKRMYENITNKKVIINCGKKLDCYGGFDAMDINLSILSMAMNELDEIKYLRTTLIKVIEQQWWNGIGDWNWEI